MSSIPEVKSKEELLSAYRSLMTTRLVLLDTNEDEGIAENGLALGKVVWELKYRFHVLEADFQTIRDEVNTQFGRITS